MEILMILAIGTLCIVCFLVGARVGQKVSKGEAVELPVLNPARVYNEEKSRKEAEKERQREALIMENIDNYDGTSIGQKDVS